MTSTSVFDSAHAQPAPDIQPAALHAVRRAQVYAFLASVVVYPRENWSEDAQLLPAIVQELDFAPAFPATPCVALEQLQAEFRHGFGAAGSLCYETEYGLPHEFRQSQELADISGFYRAFGFAVGNTIRERPDHLAVELEFMHLLAMKEAHALLNALPEHAEMCVEAQTKFLGAHLGTWIDLFAQSLALNTTTGAYPPLAEFTSAFVRADATRRGITLTPRSRKEVPHTPYDPDFSCAACPIVDLVRDR